MPALMVFDIQRFALHDGPGIRTTVFVKGCPLRCAWCHNPESMKCSPQLCYFEKNCSACGKCQKVCAHGVHHVDVMGNHTVDFAQCTACSCCVTVCPNRALKIIGKSMPVNDILQTVMLDWDFYQRSGGGLTVSGGEPMLQYEGLLELLRSAKELGIHVCLDTSGQASLEKYIAVSAHVDLFLFDYKLSAPGDHKRYTGTDQSLILANLDYLCTHGNRVYLRCPIIPGINDNEVHYHAIAALSQKYASIEQVNLMPYHDMAREKSLQLGGQYKLMDCKAIGPEETDRIFTRVKSIGCLNLHKS